MRKSISDPMSLHHLQRQFAQQITSPKGDADISPLAHLLVDSNYSPEQLLNIYHNNFVISLMQLLEQLFPATRALIGTDFFAQSCRQFIHSAPLTEPHLNHYGGQFVRFLNTLKSLEPMGFVAQMAQLEWHLDRISHIYHVPQFDFETLATVDQDEVIHIRFKLAKTCYLQSSAMDLISVHQALHAPPGDGGNDEDKQQSDQPNYHQHSYILIMQNGKGESALMALTQRQWNWLNGIEQGFTLAQLCNTTDTTLEPVLAQITDWIALGCIDGFSVQPLTPSTPTENVQ